MSDRPRLETGEFVPWEVQPPSQPAPESAPSHEEPEAAEVAPDAAEAEPVAVTPPTPARRSRALTIVTPLLALAGCIGLAALLLRPGVAISATAAGWIEAIGKSGTILEDGAVGLLLRRMVTAGLAPLAAVAILQLSVASVLLYTLARAAHRLIGPWGALTTVAVLLAWPAGRSTLLVLSAESLLALASGCILLAGLGLQDAPRRSALWLAAGVVLLALGHPVGLAALPVLAVAILLLPAPPLAEMLEDPRQGPYTRGAWLPWLAGLLLGLGLAAKLLPESGLKTLWTQDLNLLRAPTARLMPGGLASLPLLGPLVAWLGQMPFLMFLLAVRGLYRWRDEAWHPFALPHALAWLWLLVVVVVGLPVPGGLDALAVLAPVWTVAVVAEGWDVARDALQRQGRAARIAAVALGIAALLAWVADAVAGRDDRRNAIAHLPGLVPPIEALLPAALAPDDVELLLKYRDSTVILPARRGGHVVGSALKLLYPELADSAYGSAYASRLALLPQHPVHPVDRRFARMGQPIACSARHCLVRLRGRPDP